MRIVVAKSAGLCFGVKRALNIAFKTSASLKKVHMLGDIVHNEQVSREIKKAGIKKIKKLLNGKGKFLLIRAHGEPLKTYLKAKKLGYTIVDATCPMVKEIHKIALSMEKEGRRVIIIGDKEHDEVKGIAGQLKQKAIVIEDVRDIHSSKKFKGIKKAGVVVQSTQNIERVKTLLEILKRYIKDIKFANTICGPTKIKQEELKTMPLKNDIMIIVGSKHSANSKRLYQISKTLNPCTYWINSTAELRSSWFKGKEKIGITAGASTPQSTITDIIKKISSLG